MQKKRLAKGPLEVPPKALDVSSLPKLFEEQTGGKPFTEQHAFMHALTLQNAMTGRLDIPALADEYGVSLAGLNIPKKEKLRVFSPYTQPYRWQDKNDSVYTVCLGFERAKKDLTSGTLLPWWNLEEHGAVPRHIQSTGMGHLHRKPTAWGKFDFVLVDDTLQYVRMREAQAALLIIAGGMETQAVQDELQAKIDALSMSPHRRAREERRMWEKRLKRVNDHLNPPDGGGEERRRDSLGGVHNMFMYANRVMAFPLMGLALADAVGKPLVVRPSEDKPELAGIYHDYLTFAAKNTKGITVTNHPRNI